MSYILVAFLGTGFGFHSIFVVSLTCNASLQATAFINTWHFLSINISVTFQTKTDFKKAAAFLIIFIE